MTDKVKITAADCEAACDRVRAYSNYAKLDSITLLRAAWNELINSLGLTDDPEYEMNTEMFMEQFRASSNPELDAISYEIEQLVNDDRDCLKSFRRLINKAP